MLILVYSIHKVKIYEGVSISFLFSCCLLAFFFFYDLILTIWKKNKKIVVLRKKKKWGENYLIAIKIRNIFIIIIIMYFFYYNFYIIFMETNIVCVCFIYFKKTKCWLLYTNKLNNDRKWSINSVWLFWLKFFICMF